MKEKIEKISKEIYGADGVVYEPAAQKQITKIEAMGFGEFPICMAKNQYSFSDDAKKLGRPENFDIHIREVYVECRSRICCCTDRFGYDYAWTSESSGCKRISMCTEDGKITGLVLKEKQKQCS